MKRKKQYADDDGRTIVSMNVEGMRWFDRSIRPDDLDIQSKSNVHGSQMTRTEARQYTWYSILTGFYLVAVFSATWILFTLFCIYVWFR
jgi:hypothetical protein